MRTALSSCELLSKIIIFVTRNNVRMFYAILNVVVNCFQKLLSSWHETTTKVWNDNDLQLWIAFKNYYLRDTKQHKKFLELMFFRCELLSKIIIFVTRNNDISFGGKWNGVVNCFQKLLSSWHETTFQAFALFLVVLWIAFKNYYLRDTKQHILKNETTNLRCELLSKIIIFVTRNNLQRKVIK